MASYGRGSIVKRPNGRYQAQYLHSGNRVSKTFDTRAEARTWLNAQVTAAGRGELVAPSKLTVKAMLDRWIEVEGPSWAKQGLQARLDAVKRLQPLWDSTVSSLRTDQVKQWMNSLSERGQNGKPSSAATVNHALSTLKTAINCGIQWKMVAVNPIVGVARRKGPVVRPNGSWNDAQAATFMQSIAGHRLEWAFKLGIIYGMRNGEIRALSWSDVNYEKMTLTIRDTAMSSGEISRGTKGKRDRILPLSEAVATALKAHHAAQDEAAFKRSAAHKRMSREGFVFTRSDGSALSASMIRTAFYNACKDAGVDRITFHGTRHTSATTMILAGVPLTVVRDILGHANIATTAQIYAHVGQDSKADAIAASMARFEHYGGSAAERSNPTIESTHHNVVDVRSSQDTKHSQ